MAEIVEAPNMKRNFGWLTHQSGQYVVKHGFYPDQFELNPADYDALTESISHLFVDENNYVPTTEGFVANICNLIITRAEESRISGLSPTGERVWELIV